MPKKSGLERRRYKRVIFTPEDGIIGVFQPPDPNEKPVRAQVINISEGGVQLTFKSILENRIREGDRLLLTEIRGGTGSQVVINVDTEVRWISQDDLKSQTGLGCQFRDLFKDQKQEITDLVEFWYMQRVSH